MNGVRQPEVWGSVRRSREVLRGSLLTASFWDICILSMQVYVRSTWEIFDQKKQHPSVFLRRNVSWWLTGVRYWPVSWFQQSGKSCLLGSCSFNGEWHTNKAHMDTCMHAQMDSTPPRLPFMCTHGHKVQDSTIASITSSFSPTVD